MVYRYGEHDLNTKWLFVAFRCASSTFWMKRGTSLHGRIGIVTVSTRFPKSLCMVLVTFVVAKIIDALLLPSPSSESPIQPNISVVHLARIELTTFGFGGRRLFNR